MKIGLVNLLTSETKILEVKNRSKKKITFGDVLKEAEVKFNPDVHSLFFIMEGTLEPTDPSEGASAKEVLVILPKVPKVEDADQLAKILSKEKE